VSGPRADRLRAASRDASGRASSLRFELALAHREAASALAAEARRIEPAPANVLSIRVSAGYNTLAARHLCACGPPGPSPAFLGAPHCFAPSACGLQV